MASSTAVRTTRRKAQSRWLWASSALAFITVCWSSACGGTSSETIVNQNAAGEPADECEVGDTRECVGPAACKGGQRCGNEGWAMCDCGPGTSGGAGEAPANAGQGGAISGGTGVVGGNTSEGGESSGSGGFTGGGAGEGSIDGVAGEGNWVADACPEPRGLCGPASLYNAYDCSGECPELCQGYCTLSKTSPCTFTGGSGDLGDLKGREVPLYVPRRMPAAAPFAGLCSCPSGKPVVVRWLASAWNGFPTHVRISPPWHLSPPQEDTCAPATHTQCLILPYEEPPVSKSLDQATFQVWTSEPNAPAANLQIYAGPCPE